MFWAELTESDILRSVSNYRRCGHRRPKLSRVSDIKGRYQSFEISVSMLESVIKSINKLDSVLDHIHVSSSKQPKNIDFFFTM